MQRARRLSAASMSIMKCFTGEAEQKRSVLLLPDREEIQTTSDAECDWGSERARCDWPGGDRRREQWGERGQRVRRHSRHQRK